MSRAEVAKVMGITRQAVHQAERRAIAKLRSALFPMWRQMKEEGAL
jgi:DNA-directed RNA polymerase specialized sigma subunit